VGIVYRWLGRAFIVYKNRDLEGNNFLAALGLVCMLMTSSQHGVAVRTKKQKCEKSDSLKKKEHKNAKAEKIAQKKQKREEKERKKFYISTVRYHCGGWSDPLADSLFAPLS
jgi:hypothetical protein